MISERKFAEAFTSFWQQLLPTADGFVRRTNLRLQRFREPLKSPVPAGRRALVNELGFQVFASIGKSKTISRLTSTSLKRVESASSRLVSLGLEPDVVDKLSKVECAEVLELASRLAQFFRQFDRPTTLLLSPPFPGCGMINNCNGDVLADDTLYEIKAGDRDFRLVDIRQVIVYAALNHAGECFRISKLGLLNPRVGVFFKVSLESLARESGAGSAIEMFSEIAEFVSSNQSSL